MTTNLPDIVTGEIGLAIGPRAERAAMLELTAVLALGQPVRVLDGGNCFDAYHIARQIRRHTHQLDEALNRISIARAFTCYQVISLFAETPAASSPQLVLDLLATFYDESVTVQESYRLLRIVIDHLHRLKQSAPVIISVRPPPEQQPERAGLIAKLQEIASHIFIREVPMAPAPMRLF